MRFTVSNPGSEFAAAMRKIKNPIAKAATGAMRECADLAKRNGRANIAAAGFSVKWQNALRANVYPASGVSISPAAFVYHKVPYADIFETGGTISGQPMLWLPLPTVPIGRGGLPIRASQYKQQIGMPLVSMRVSGNKPPMLGAYVRQTAAASAKPLSARALRRGKAAKRGTLRLVPLYIGVSVVSITKKFDLIATIRQAAAQLPNLYDQQLKDV